MSQATDVYYDPDDVEISADPYPVFRRLRDDGPDAVLAAIGDGN